MNYSNVSAMTTLTNGSTNDSEVGDGQSGANASDTDDVYTTRSLLVAVSSIGLVLNLCLFIIVLVR